MNVILALLGNKYVAYALAALAVVVSLSGYWYSRGFSAAEDAYQAEIRKQEAEREKALQLLRERLETVRVEYEKEKHRVREKVKVVTRYVNRNVASGNKCFDGMFTETWNRIARETGVLATGDVREGSRTSK